ncbi:MAG TPA: IS110 family transposase [Chloroflexota bacterium]|jgi:transposase|nr:IS110 family transposase [Chloroflexota bacterium]
MHQDKAFVGLDVHRENIAVAVAVGREPPQFQGVVANRPEAVRKWVQKLRRRYTDVLVAYEAGPCGFALYRHLEQLGLSCQVVAPSLIPRPAGQRVKTDRRDALLLARLLRSGDLTPVWVPDAEHEALRDLVRAREAALADRVRVTNRLRKLLLRSGIYPPRGVRSHTRGYQRWLAAITLPLANQQFVLNELRSALAECNARLQRLEAEVLRATTDSHYAPLIAAYQCLRGIGALTAVTLVAELGDLRRFHRARPLMAYAGLVPSEYSSGDKQQRGALTKAGNPHVRRVVIESAWHSRHIPRVGIGLKRRQAGQPDAIRSLSWKAQQRLHRRYHALVRRTRNAPKAAAAVARELIGFIWAIAQQVPPTPVQAAAA